MVYAVLYNNDICFMADNEEDIVNYLRQDPEIGFSDKSFEEKFGVSVQTWLDDGHRVDELNDEIKSKFYIQIYHLGYDYRKNLRIIADT